MRRFLVFVPPLKEASLWLKRLYNLLFENMENVVFQQMEDHGPRACIFLNVEHHFHSSFQKIIERTIHSMRQNRML
jgi:hypothetical protein